MGLLPGVALGVFEDLGVLFSGLGDLVLVVVATVGLLREGGKGED
jgi:hypothetical protein